MNTPLIPSGNQVHAVVAINVGEFTLPGTYALSIGGSGAHGPLPGVAFLLTVAARIPPCPQNTGPCEQWAMSATASSEYTSQEWSAKEATGEPNVSGCSDDVHAWASFNANGVDWLELRYATSVRPSEIQIYESWGPSSIVRVEVQDDAGVYHTVYTAFSGRTACPHVLAIPITGITETVRTVRVSLDQRALNDWNEIDAVKLVGSR